MAERERIVILGGGMGALSAAWYLSRPGWQDRFERITVYQRGWRLGGKGASGRGIHDRIEEHGLHVMLGYYHNVFRLLDDVYRELDRPTTDPACPVQGLGDALVASPRVGVTDLHGDVWSTWTARFTTQDRLPTTPGRPPGPMTVVELARRAVQLLVDFSKSTVGAHDPNTPTNLVALDLTPDEPPLFDRLVNRTGRATTLGSRAVLSILGGALEAVAAVQTEGRRWFRAGDPFVGFAAEALDVVYERLRRLVEPDDAARRFFQLADVVVTILRGLAVDGVLTNPRRMRALNDNDFCDWLRHHGAAEITARSPLIRGVYDLGFAYRDGDPGRPAFPAGLGIYLSGRMFFDYQGSIFWKLRGGMGDVIFAPMYQALERRGVRFEFFHQVDNLGLGPSRSVDTIELTRQVDLAEGRDRYDPLIDVGGLPSWPAVPIQGQLREPVGVDVESIWGDPERGTRVELRRGDDFDRVVFGIPVGMAPYVCRELVAESPRWKDMVSGMGTVPTQALQMWLAPPEAALGWDEGDVTISGYVEPFDTWASMSHVLRFESWPAPAPATVAYFCNALQTTEPPTAEGHERALEHVRVNAVHFLDHHVGLFWPEAVDVNPNRFRWDLLTAPPYLRANLDPSERYVQALPGTDRYRIRSGETGYDNLVVAGDWTDSGLNAGCLESAVMSGMQAAHAISGAPGLDEIAALAELREYFG